MTKFLQEITDFIFLEDEPKNADVIFLPGSNEGALAVTAAALYHKGYAPVIVPSGKYAKWVGKCGVEGYETECDYFTKILREADVPKTAILQEKEATYTYENAKNTKKILEEKQIQVKRALLCCQAFHARRCKLYYQIVFPDTEILVCPTITKDISRDNWFLTKEKTDKVLGEIERIGTQFHDIVAQYR